MSNVPKLIDNKRKSLEKRLSAAQRDQKLIEAAKGDTAMRKDMLECFRDSSRSTAQAMENMSTTLREMSQGMTQAMVSLANAFNRPRQHVEQHTIHHFPHISINQYLMVVEIMYLFLIMEIQMIKIV